MFNLLVLAFYFLLDFIDADYLLAQSGVLFHNVVL